MPLYYAVTQPWEVNVPTVPEVPAIPEQPPIPPETIPTPPVPAVPAVPGYRFFVAQGTVCEVVEGVLTGSEENDTVLLKGQALKHLEGEDHGHPEEVDFTVARRIVVWAPAPAI